MTTTIPSPHDVAAVPCAQWCSDGNGHLDQHPEDRYCHSPFVEVSTSLGKPERYTDGVWRLPWLNVYLRREWRETESRMVLHNEETDAEVLLTLDEAAALRDALTGLIAVATSAEAAP